jgi:hypothetical protein
MNLPPAFSYVAWTGLALSGEGMCLGLKNFAETLEKESPQTWEAIGKPRFGYFGGNAGQVGRYLRDREYLSLGNKAVTQAGFWARIANRAFGLCASLLVLYYVLNFLLSHPFPTPPPPK